MPSPRPKENNRQQSNSRCPWVAVLVVILLLLLILMATGKYLPQHCDRECHHAGILKSHDLDRHRSELRIGQPGIAHDYVIDPFANLMDSCSVVPPTAIAV